VTQDVNIECNTKGKGSQFVTELMQRPPFCSSRIGPKRCGVWDVGL